MANTLKFRFGLNPVGHIEAWGEPTKRSLHWFGLTDGWQYLETSSGRLLEYDQTLPAQGQRWVEYPVARLLEDLLTIWPEVRDPVPEDIASSFFEWYSAAEERKVYEGSDDPSHHELWEEACSWWHSRQLNFQHLTHAPEVHLWNTGGNVTLKWDARGVDPRGPRWAPQHALVTMTLAKAQAALESFCAELLSAMEERVSTIQREGWRRSDCTLDVENLVAEQRKRKSWADVKLAQIAVADWDKVRRALAKLKTTSIP